MAAVTPGTEWEIGQIVTNPGLLRKTIFIMAPKNYLEGLSARKSKYDARASWEEFRDLCHSGGLSMPPYEDAGGFVTIDKAGNPDFLKGLININLERLKTMFDNIFGKPAPPKHIALASSKPRP